jgi:hypothetical protein
LGNSLMSARLAAVTLTLCTAPLSTSAPIWIFMPKYH